MGKVGFLWKLRRNLHIPQNAVVVIDNASIHNKREEGTPTRNTRKADMQNWLIEKNVEFSPSNISSFMHSE